MDGAVAFSFVLFAIAVGVDFFGAETVGFGVVPFVGAFLSGWDVVDELDENILSVALFFGDIGWVA